MIFSVLESSVQELEYIEFTMKSMIYKALKSKT